MVVGAQDVCEENPGARIIVLDTLNVSLGEGLFVLKAAVMREAGKSIDEVAQWLEEHKLEFCVRFTVNDLFHLQRGGRISKTTAIVGSMINIKPILYVDQEGRLVALKSIRGRRKSLNTLCDEMMDSIGNMEIRTIRSASFTGCFCDAGLLEARVRELLPEKQIIMNFVSRASGHSGRER